MSWFIFLIFLYIAFNTIKYAQEVWKNGNRLAGIFIAMLSLSLVGLPIFVLFN